MERFSGNPILRPIGEHEWEAREVFNAGAVNLNGKVHIFYRAIGNDGVSRIGYAASTDGFHIDERFPQPVFEPANDIEKDGCEDPRLVEINNQLIMTYTALREYSHLQVYQACLTTIDVEDFLQKQWKWGIRKLPFPGIRNKDAVVFPKKINGRYAMLHRIEPDICLAYSDDLVRWCDIMSVMKPRANGWDNWKIGAGGPPIELNEGWLMIYHGVDHKKTYALGAALLDKNNPEKVLYRSEEPILTPCEGYECVGYVPNVVFSCGNVLLDNQVIVYYGGADSVLCAASYELSELLPKK